MTPSASLVHADTIGMFAAPKAQAPQVPQVQVLNDLLRVRWQAMASRHEPTIQTAKRYLDSLLTASLARELHQRQHRLLLEVAKSIQHPPEGAHRIIPPIPSSLVSALSMDLAHNVHFFPPEYKNVHQYARDLIKTYGEYSDTTTAQWIEELKSTEFESFMQICHCPSNVQRPKPNLSVPVLFRGRQLPTALHRCVCHFLTAEDLLLGLAPVSRNWLDWTWTQFPFVVYSLPMFGSNALRQLFFGKLFEPIWNASNEAKSVTYQNKKRRLVNPYRPTLALRRMDVTVVAMMRLKQLGCLQLDSVQYLGLHHDNEQERSHPFNMGKELALMFPNLCRVVMYQSHAVIHPHVLTIAKRRLPGAFDGFYNIQLYNSRPYAPRTLIFDLLNALRHFSRLEEMDIIGSQLSIPDELNVMRPDKSNRFRLMVNLKSDGCAGDFEAVKTRRFIRDLHVSQRAHTLRVFCGSSPHCSHDRVRPLFQIDMQKPLSLSRNIWRARLSDYLEPIDGLFD